MRIDHEAPICIDGRSFEAAPTEPADHRNRGNSFFEAVRGLGKAGLRVLPPALKIAGGIYIGSIVGSQTSCVENTPGGQPVEVCTEISPLDWSGGSNLDLGIIEDYQIPDTHKGPISFSFRPQTVDFDNPAVQKLSQDPESLERSITSLLRGIKNDIEPGIHESLLKGALGFMAVNVAVWGLGPLANLRNNEKGRQMLAGGLAKGVGVGLALTLVGSGRALTTIGEDPMATAYPTGLLTKAGDIADNIQNAISNTEAYGNQIAAKASYAYEAMRTANEFSSMPDRDKVVRVLVLSDRHLNTVPDTMYKNLAAQANVDVVAIPGDDSDYGTPVEYGTYELFTEFEDRNGDAIPVLVVGGNHERSSTMDYVSTLDNVTVLEGQVEEIDGLGFTGMPDPRYSPEHDQDESANSREMIALSNNLSEIASDDDAEVVIVHDPTVARRIALNTGNDLGTILSGHTHKRSDELINGKNFHIEGSSGAAGARGLESDTPLEFSIIDLDKKTGRIAGGVRFTVQFYGAEAEVSATNFPKNILYSPPEDDDNQAKLTDPLNILTP